MHFITGGAFNGKAEWVRNYYDGQDLQQGWLSAYKPSFSAEQFEDVASFHKLTVIQGLEKYVKEILVTSADKDQLRKRWQALFSEWKSWEEEIASRRLIVIGNDITKGIVPASKKERLWRDLTGWCYQDLVRQCKRVDIIWFGISQNVSNPMRS